MGQSAGTRAATGGARGRPRQAGDDGRRVETRARGPRPPRPARCGRRGGRAPGSRRRIRAIGQEQAEAHARGAERLDVRGADVGGRREAVAQHPRRRVRGHARRRGSSALRTAAARAAAPRPARACRPRWPRSKPARERCTPRTAVTTPMDGRARRASRAISPVGRGPSRGRPRRARGAGAAASGAGRSRCSRCPRCAARPARRRAPRRSAPWSRSWPASR